VADLKLPANGPGLVCRGGPDEPDDLKGELLGAVL
jgi:hypothetical protein